MHLAMIGAVHEVILLLEHEKVRHAIVKNRGRNIDALIGDVIAYLLT